MAKLYPRIVCLFCVCSISYSLSAAGKADLLSSFFIENKGQVVNESGQPAANVLFYTTGSPLQLFVTTSGYSMVQRQSTAKGVTYNRIDIKLEGAQIMPGKVIYVEGSHPKINYYSGKKRMMGVDAYSTIIIHDIYPGIDWLWSMGDSGKLQHEFMVNIGADASVIKYSVNNATASVQAGSSLLYNNAQFTVREGPINMQYQNKITPVNLNMNGNGVSFQIPAELKKGGFTIDPPIELMYANGIDSSLHTSFNSIVADDLGYTYTVGYSSDYSVPVFAVENGAYNVYPPENTDVVIMKTDPNQNLIWATFFGGSNNDEANAVTWGGSEIYITGYSESWDFPVAVSGNYNQLVSLFGRNAFVAGFDSSGILQWCTGYGGSGPDEGMDIKYYNGKVDVAGYTYSKDFPVQQRAGSYFHQDSLRTAPDGFLLEFDSVGDRLWATTFGGSAKDYFTSLYTDATGIYLTGYSDSITDNSFPLQSFGSAYYQTTYQKTESFVTAFAPGGALEWSTYFGGPGNDVASCILRNQSGLMICGKTDADGLPVQTQNNGNYFQPNYAGGLSDGFIAKFDASTLQKDYCTYYGTSGTDVLTKFASDANSLTIFTGFTNSLIPEVTPLNFFHQDTLVGGYDALMLGLDSLQRPYWSTLFGSPGNDFGYSVQFTSPSVVDMVGEGIYNYGKLRIGGTYASTGCDPNTSLCPWVTCNGVSNRFFNFLPGTEGGGNGCIPLYFQALIPLKNTCPNQCNGVARIDTSNILGCPPYQFVWSDGHSGLRDSSLCQFYWSRVIDAAGDVRTIYGMFDVLRVPPLDLVSTDCRNITPNWDSLIHPMGGGPPYSILFRGTSLDSCPTNAYFSISDTANCIVPFTTLWAQNNIALEPSIKLDGNCNVTGSLTWEKNSCVDLSNASKWKYVLINGTDTTYTNYSLSGPVVLANAPLEGGTYRGYLDILDCNIPFSSFYYYPPIQSWVSYNIPCGDSLASLTISMLPDTLAFDSNGNYQVDVYLESNNYGTQYNVFNITSLDTQTITFSGLEPDMYRAVVFYSMQCDSNVTQVDLSKVNFKFNTPTVYCAQQALLQATVTGGTAPYTYTWSPPDGDSAAIHITQAGTYALTVTDSLGCYISGSQLVPGSPNVILDTLIQNLVPCAQTLYMEAEAEVSGGTGQIKFLWSSGETTSLAQFLPVGSNWLIFTDSYGCADTVNFMNTKQPLVQAYDSVIDVTCNGYKNGIAYVNISEGYQPYSVEWSDSATGNPYTNLDVGTYGYAVTDSKGCSASGFAVITQPDSVHYFVAQGDADCSAADGYAVVGVTGGVSPYSIIWNDNDTAFYRPNLPTGTYTFTLSDGNGCQKVGTVVIGQKSPMYFTVSATAVTCSGDSNGSASVAVFNALSPFTYAWSNGSDSSTISYLPGGSYSITVTDNGGCIKDTTIYINIPQSLQILVDTGSGIVCNNGSAEGFITVLGGTGPYQGDGFVILSPGDNPISVSDFNGCSADTDVVLSNPPVFNPSVQIVSQPSCNTDSGSVFISDSGGVPPYTVTIDNYYTNIVNDTITIGGVSGGNHFITIQDSHGCSQQFNIAMNPYNTLQGFIIPVNPACYGNSTGSFSLTMFGDSPFTVSGQTFNDSITLTGYVAGTYSFPVVDNAGCMDTLSATIVNPPQLTGNYNIIQNIICAGDSATVNIYNTGGTEPVEGTGVFHFPGGPFQQVVTDTNGCTVTVSGTIISPDTLFVSDTIMQFICGQPAQVTISTTGGIKPYELHTGSSVLVFSQSITETLPAGSYTYQVSDSLGCTHSISFNVVTSDTLRGTAVATNPLCYTDSNGTVTITMQHGDGPFTVNGRLFDGLYQFDSLAAGNYTFVVQDARGCIDTLAATIVTPAKLTGTYQVVQGIICSGDSATVDIFSSGGTQPVTGTGAYHLPGGSFNEILTDTNGCMASVSGFLLSPPDSLAINYRVFQATCNSPATITIFASGGIGPYTLYTGSAAYPFADSISQMVNAGSYTYQVTDSLGCTKSISFTITVTDSTSGKMAVRAPKCFDDGTGALTIVMQSGADPFYADSLPFFDSVTLNEPPGTYVFTVHDSRGCSTILYGTITQPDQLEDTSLVASGITCAGLSDGTIRVEGAGGTPPYNYELLQNSSPLPVSGPPFTQLSAGGYTVQITDENGCQNSEPATILPFVPHNNFVSTDSINCYGGNDGAIHIYSQPGADAPFTYSLDNGAQQPYNVFYDLSAGTYTIIVSDKNNCMDTLTVNINQPDSIDGRVWLNGQLLPVDTYTINERANITFSKENNQQWTVSFLPPVDETVEGDTAVTLRPHESVAYTVKVYSNTGDTDCFVEYQGFIDVTEVPTCPNTITPNGDGKNDKWEIDLDKLPHCKVTICDRWGEIVYKSDDYNNEWDGTYQNSGKHVPDGTYFYILIVPSQQDLLIKGDINVLDSLN